MTTNLPRHCAPRLNVIAASEPQSILKPHRRVPGLRPARFPRGLFDGCRLEGRHDDTLSGQHEVCWVPALRVGESGLVAVSKQSVFDNFLGTARPAAAVTTANTPNVIAAPARPARAHRRHCGACAARPRRNLLQHLLRNHPGSARPYFRGIFKMDAGGPTYRSSPA